MKRVFLFLLTNLAVIFVLSVVLRLLGVDSVLDKRGGLDMNALLAFSAVFGMGGSLISLALSKFMAKRATGARVIANPTHPTEQWLVQTVAQQAQAAGIGMPEVAIFPSDAPNAFATGASRNSALVAVSSGLLQRMSRQEVEAVVGHEVSHVANGDMITLTLIQGVVNTFVIFLSRVVGFYVDKVVFKTERGVGPAYFVTYLVAQLVFGILASLVVMGFSRQREFRADAGGARLAGRESMIAALQRLKASAEQPSLPREMNAFGISGDGRGIMRLFMSHPPLDERIARLRAQA